MSLHPQTQVGTADAKYEQHIETLLTTMSLSSSEVVWCTVDTCNNGHCVLWAQGEKGHPGPVCPKQQKSVFSDAQSAT